MLSLAHPLNDKKSHIEQALQRHPVQLHYGAGQQATFTLTAHHPATEQSEAWCWDIGALLGPCPLRVRLPDIALDPSWHNGLSSLWDKADPAIQSAFMADQAHHIIDACAHQLGLSVEITDARHIANQHDPHPTDADMLSLHGLWTLSHGNTIPVCVQIPQGQHDAWIAILQRFASADATIHHPISIPAYFLYGLITIESIEHIHTWHAGDIVFFDVSPRMHQPVLCLGKTLRLSTRKDQEQHIWLDAPLPPAQTEQESYVLECHSDRFPICLSKLTGTNPQRQPIPIPPQKQSLILSLKNHTIATCAPTMISNKRGIRLQNTPSANDTWQQALQNKAR
ncbi:MAG: hypothetical protein GDA54_03125 [Alphaproteobacteria bacterium GM7ARS4]|nr:hypothetical protein [Alphaproteobacteria bacterium GM7ARS4]